MSNQEQPNMAPSQSGRDPSKPKRKTEKNSAYRADRMQTFLSDRTYTVSDWIAGGPSRANRKTEDAKREHRDVLDAVRGLGKDGR